MERGTRPSPVSMATRFFRLEFTIELQIAVDNGCHVVVFRLGKCTSALVSAGPARCC